MRQRLSTQTIKVELKYYACFSTLEYGFLEEMDLGGGLNFPEFRSIVVGRRMSGMSLYDCK